MGKRHLLFVFVFVCLLTACGGASSGDGGEDAESGDSAQSGASGAGVYAISGDASTGHLYAKAGYQRIAIVGARIGELAAGQSYFLSLEPTTEKVDKLTTRALVDYRKVLHLAGTLADDAADPSAIALTTIHGKRFALYGNTVTTYKGIRAGLPQHDYSKTLFTVDAVEDIAQAARFTWIGYAPSPSYRCTEDDATQVHVDLVSVQPDDSLFDGFVVTETGGEPNYGARATCGHGRCTFDAVGTPWGAADFAPAARFPLVVVRADQAATHVAFTCSALDRAAVASEQ